VRSTKFDRLFHNVIEWRVLGRQSHTQFQFGAFKLSFANNALNLPLRGDADHLEELTYSHVEPILVHLASRKPVLCNQELARCNSYNRADISIAQKYNYKSVNRCPHHKH